MAISPNLRARAVSGTLITLGAQGVKFVVQFAWSVTLARILGAEPFGIYAMATPIFALTMLIQDLGLVQSIITRREIDDRAVSTIFLVNLGVSSGLAALLAIAAPSISAFYHDDRLKVVIYAMAVILIFSGALSVQRAVLIRNMQYKRIAILETVSLTLGAMFSVVWALAAPSPLALVASNFFGTLILLLMLSITSSWRPGRPASLKSVADMLRFGGGLTGFNIANYFSRNADNVIIGRTLGSVELGLYDRAYKLMLTPLQQVNSPVTSVIMPILAKLQDEPLRYKQAYVRAVSMLLSLTLPAIIFFMMAADPLIPFTLGNEWRPAIQIFAWLAFAGLHQPLTHTMGWLFTSQHRTGEFAAQGVCAAVVNVTAFLYGVRFGAVGVAAAYAISNVCILMPLTIWWAGRRGPVSWRDILHIAKPNVVASTLSIVCLAGIKGAISTPDWATLGILLLTSYAVFWTGLALTRTGRNSLSEAAKLVAPLKGRKV